MSFLKSAWNSRYGGTRFRLMDIACMGYFAAVGIGLLFFHKAVNNWLFYVIMYLVLTLVILEYVRYAEKHPQNKIVWFVRTIQSHAGIAGAAFPSSHISEVFVLSLVALRYVRKLGYFLLPLTFVVSISTVYLRYHHAVDPIFGYLWGSLCFLFTLRILINRSEEPLSLESKRQIIIGVIQYAKSIMP
jgi:membrane-associated phospholipid phosphatase